MDISDGDNENSENNQISLLTYYHLKNKLGIK